MMDPSTMERERSYVYASSARKVSAHIVQNLVTVDVAVIVGDRDGLGMIIQLPRHKGEYVESRSFERLMNWWRLMDSAGQGFEVVHIKDPRIKVTVPTDHIERIVIENIRHQLIVYLDPNLKFSLIVVSHEFAG